MNLAAIIEKQHTLSPDQERALNIIKTTLMEPGSEAVLVGAAGTGKTTLMRRFLDEWAGSVKLVAPTGKAARRLQEVTGYKATTIHSALYKKVEELGSVKGRPRLIFLDPKPPVSPGGLLVVDEASMVGKNLYEEIMDQLHRVGGSVLWVGDKAQLEPVNDTWGPDLDDPTAELTQVHRQALTSPILELATLIRNDESRTFDNYGDAVSYEQGGIPDAARWAVGKGDRVCLTWTNKVRQRINLSCREQLGFTEPLVPGDKILVTRNNHAIGVVNGDVFTVAAVSPHVLGNKATDFVLIETTNGFEFISAVTQIGGDFNVAKQMARGTRGVSPELLVSIDYGYCLTVHRSQGSQWREVRFIECYGLRNFAQNKKREDFVRRLWYTAVTRSQKQLTLQPLS